MKKALLAAVAVMTLALPASAQQRVDDTAFPAGGLVLPMGCFQTTDVIDAGDIGAIRCNVDRELIVNVDSISDGGNSITIDDGGTTLSIDDGAGSITVDGPLTNAELRAAAVPVDSELPTAETPADNLANGTAAPRALSFGMLFDGTAWDRAPGTSADGALVNLGANNDVTVTSGTVTANQGTPAATANRWPVQLTDGTDSVTVLNLAGEDPLAVAIVDGSGSQITSFGGGTQYTEDAVAAADPLGTAVNLVRADMPAGIASANGDNVAQRGTNFGAAYVQVVTSSGAFIDSFGGSGGTSSTDDGSFTAASGLGTPMMGFVTTDLVDSGDVGVVRMTATRDLMVTIRDGAGDNIVDDAGNALRVNITGSTIDLAVAGTQQVDSVFDATTLFGLAARASNATPAAVSADGDAQALWVDLNGRLHVADGGGSLTIDAASLPLPTGASTLAEQQTQTTALQLIDNIPLADDAAFTVATTNVAAMGCIEATDTMDAGDVGAVKCGNDRELDVDVISLPSVTIGTFPDNEPINVAQINGVTPLMGNGVTGTGSPRVTIASDNTAFTVNVGTFPDNEPVNVAQMNGVAVTMGNGVAGTGVQRVAVASDNTPFGVILKPTTSGGTTMHRLLSAATTNATNVKASAGQVYGLQVFNTNANEAYLKLYNSASAPTCGSGTPVKTLTIPGNAAGAGFIALSDLGWAFSTGIGYCITTGPADADTGAVAANEVIVNMDYN